MLVAKPNQTLLENIEVWIAIDMLTVDSTGMTNQRCGFKSQASICWTKVAMSPIWSGMFFYEVFMRLALHDGFWLHKSWSSSSVCQAVQAVFLSMGFARKVLCCFENGRKKKGFVGLGSVKSRIRIKNGQFIIVTGLGVPVFLERKK